MKTQIILLCTAVAMAFSAATVAATDAYLADRHAARQVTCNMCHTKSMNAKPEQQDCLKCHGGSYAELAKKTDKSDINPHDTHLGEADCTDCHSGHKKPKLVCDGCHEDFGNELRVP